MKARFWTLNLRSIVIAALNAKVQFGKLCAYASYVYAAHQRLLVCAVGVAFVAALVGYNLCK